MKHKLLIVDDEVDARVLASDILEDLYEIECAENVSDAIEKVKSFSPEIILSDIKMPGESGIDLLKKVKETDPQIYVIMLTGHGDKSMAIEAMRSGAFDFLDKPFEDEEILSAVERAVTIIKLNKEMNDIKKRAIQSEKMASLGVMSGGVAHEINTPLGSIMLSAQAIEKYLLRELPDIEKALKLSQNIQGVVEHISKITGALRSFCRESSNHSFEVSRVSTLLEKALYICENNLKKADVSIISKIENTNHWEISCRPSEIIQIFVSLINNACDAVENLGDRWIKIEVEEFSASLKIKITDSGPGIKPAEVDQIFQPFYSTKGCDERTGLGLYLSKGLIHSHGGTLEVDDNAKNTCFILTIPS